MNPIREALAEAGKKFDGHVTEGSLDAQWKVICDAWARENDNICQILGKALGYPWYKDDPKNFPGTTEANGVCVGDHVAESIAAEAAAKINQLG